MVYHGDKLILDQPLTNITSKEQLGLTNRIITKTMTHTLKTSLWLVLSGLTMAFLVAGCTTTRETSDSYVAVKRSSCFLMHFAYYEPDDSDMYINIDIPVKGPKALTDSITVFFNEQLYCLFDNGEDRHLPYEKVYSNNLSDLAMHYWQTYRPFYGKDAPYITPFVHWFELKMVAQTDTYVTYEIVSGFMGEGPEESRYWTTFVKKDGHRVKEVISSQNMLRFMEDYPEMKASEIWCNTQRYKKEGYEIFLNNVGLLADSLAFQYFWAMGIYEDIQYPLTVIKPYLSEEAQESLSGNGLFHKELVIREIELPLGTVTTTTGDTVYLAAWYDAVTTYTKNDSGYVPIEGFEIGAGCSRLINTWNDGGWYESNPHGRYFAFNPTDNTLYVPKVRIVSDKEDKEWVSYNDRYYVYQFNGERFVGKGEDGGFWLYPSVRQFESLVFNGKTEDYQVRVDSLADGTYRLTAWKNKADMNDVPDILVEGGVCEKSIYVFNSGDYTYKVMDQLLRQNEFQSYDKTGNLFFSQNLNKVYH